MSNPLHSISEDVPLTYNRNIDYMCWGGREPNDNEQFFKALPKVVDKGKKKQGKSMIFFKKLGVPLRRKIYSYVYEINPAYKEVNLSMDFAVKALFPAGHFIVPWDLIHQVAGAFLSGRQMRDELLTYFWSTYHFHVTFSAFTTGPTFSGLSHKWLNLYAKRVNHLTIEVDFTTFSFSVSKDAKLLKAATGGVQKQIRMLAGGLAGRVHKNVMATLTLKLRRFWGYRPHEKDASEEDKLIPYCPEDAQLVFQDLKKLKWMLLQLRMAGFTPDYTKSLSGSLFENRATRPRAVIVPAWPIPNVLPPQFKHKYEPALNSNTGSGSGAGAGLKMVAEGSGSAAAGASSVATSSPPSLRAAVEEAHAARIASSPGSSKSTTGLTRSGAIRRPSRSRSQSTEAPKSPNTMNALNAQDPAFTRAFNAMRLDPEENDRDKEGDKKDEADDEDEADEENGSPVAKKNTKNTKKGKNKGKGKGKKKH